MKITTSYIRPPVPTNRFDWQAIYDDYEDSFVGYGATEQAAINDLQTRYAEYAMNEDEYAEFINPYFTVK